MGTLMEKNKVAVLEKREFENPDELMLTTFLALLDNQYFYTGTNCIGFSPSIPQRIETFRL